MVAQGSHEAGAMNEGRLDEEVAPEKDISTDIHSYPIPFHDEAWTL